MSVLCADQAIVLNVNSALGRVAKVGYGAKGIFKQV